MDENAEHVVTPQQQYDPSAEVDVEGREYVINYGQIYLSKPTMTEADGETGVLFPKEARLRNLTCVGAPLHLGCIRCARHSASRCAGAMCQTGCLMLVGCSPHGC